jgi:hypothetical protein
MTVGVAAQLVMVTGCGALVVSTGTVPKLNAVGDAVLHADDGVPTNPSVFPASFR